MCKKLYLKEYDLIMVNESFLEFNVLTKPEKDLFKKIQSNAKFKTISDVLKTKVGINNFYNFSI